jgi:protein TonB
VLDASVDASGHVIDARVITSVPMLDQAARDAVLQWEYEPTVVDGDNVPLTLTVTVNFVLRDGAATR